ncbi:hypothetical protein BCR41DRAFT_398238 [Lobosporangium transversale]|uniref:Uncharacterized protein n=1 Tax=Lobosporangium transversale TaxID=64571 RepID=A0A1Y2GGV3_9FUNG|nr:hypothetical protein BCR41DRAFT_398238 [Lobosporangium transversale]ORZ10587.1 hypothetical protein BCR41DRAFT_398238 [Lobosporangium transversale]|eukprot:XP_021879308.1 hypothetical protein BCR41DRAFT_398238 [Lobosporangium transversale]
MARSVAFLISLLALLQTTFAATLSMGRIKRGEQVISIEKTNSASPTFLIHGGDFSKQGGAYPQALIVAGYAEQKWGFRESEREKGSYNLTYPKELRGSDWVISVLPVYAFPPRIALQLGHGRQSLTTHWKLEKIRPSSASYRLLEHIDAILHSKGVIIQKIMISPNEEHTATSELPHGYSTQINVAP